MSTCLSDSRNVLRVTNKPKLPVCKASRISQSIPKAVAALLKKVHPAPALLRARSQPDVVVVAAALRLAVAVDAVAVPVALLRTHRNSTKKEETTNAQRHSQ